MSDNRLKLKVNFKNEHDAKNVDEILKAALVFADEHPDEEPDLKRYLLQSGHLSADAPFDAFWYVDKVMRNGKKVTIDLLGSPAEEFEGDMIAWLQNKNASTLSAVFVFSETGDTIKFKVKYSKQGKPELKIQEAEELSDEILQDPFTIDINGNTKLHYAESAKEVKALLKAGLDINAKNNIGLTPLLSAIRSWNYRVVEALLKAGADINALDKQGRPPLFYARNEEVWEIFNLLLDSGADTSICFKYLPDCRNNDEEECTKELEGTVLDYAISSWEKDLIDILEKRGAVSKRGKTLTIDLEMVKKIDAMITVPEGSVFLDYKNALKWLTEEKVPTFDGEEQWNIRTVRKASDYAWNMGPKKIGRKKPS